MNKSPFNLKSILTGVFLGLLLVLCAQYSANVLLSNDGLSYDHLPAIGIFFFFLLCLFLNPLLKLLSGRRFFFAKSELLVVYTMLLTFGSVAESGLGGFLLPMLVGLKYFATPMNRWEELILPHIKDWLVPKDPTAVRDFYEGASVIPWAYWLRVLFPWFIFLLVFFFTTIAIVSLLRKRWVEQERLNFALNSLAVSMTEEPKSGLLGSIFKSRAMWIGFAIAFLCSFSGVLHYFLPVLPVFRKYMVFGIFRGTAALAVAISFPIIGFMFFVNAKLSLSLWFFAVFFKLMEGYLNIIGASSLEYLGAGSFNAVGGPIFAHLCFGALMAYVLHSLFVARINFREAFLKAIGRGRDVDDSGEMMSHSFAFWGLVIGYLFLVGWLVVAGMTLWVAAVFLLLVYLVIIGLTKVVAQGGLLTLKTPSLASSQLVSVVGSERLGPDNMVNLGLSYIYHSKLRSMPMVAAIHSAKLGEEIRKNIRPLFWVIMLSLVLGMVSSNLLLLGMAYHYGGINMNEWMMRSMAQYPWDFVSNHLMNPSFTVFSGIFLKITGFVVMILITLAYKYLSWFPFHPLGFAVASTYRVMLPWFSVFLGWLFHNIVLKYGGPKSYNNAKPFFLGLILGAYAAAGVWFIIQLIIPNMPTGMVIFYV